MPTPEKVQTLFKERRHFPIAPTEARSYYLSSNELNCARVGVCRLREDDNSPEAILPVEPDTRQRLSVKKDCNESATTPKRLHISLKTSVYASRQLKSACLSYVSQT